MPDRFFERRRRFFETGRGFFVMSSRFFEMGRGFFIMPRHFFETERRFFITTKHIRIAEPISPGRIVQIAPRAIISLMTLFAVVWLLPQPAAQASADLPVWLRQVAGSALPGYGKEVPAVVLWDESHV